VTVTHKVARPLAPDIAARIIADLSVWQVHRPGVEDVLDVIRSGTLSLCSPSTPVLRNET